MKNMRRRMMVLLLALALMLLGATAGAEDKKYTIDLVSGTSATLPGGIDAQFLNHVPHRVMDVDGGMNVFFDLNDDGENDVLMFMPSDQNNPWPCSRLEGANLLTQDYSVTYADQGTGDNITIEFKVYAVVHVHTYGAPTWEWATDNRTAKAVFNCTKGDDTQKKDASVEDNYYAPTCTADGYTIYIAKASFNGMSYTDEKTVTDAGTATGHSYGAPTWKWADGYSAATATFKCAQGDDTQTVNATVADKTTAATCTADGYTVYTATVKFDGKDYTDEKTVTDAGTATGHSYGAPEWSWAGDNSAATATFKCAQGDDSQTVDATVKSDKTEPTCTADGKTVYTATAKFSGKDYTDEKTVTDAGTATGHSYGEPEWSWKDDNSAATATFKCARGDDSQTVDATVKSDKAEPTCTADGKTVYTATAKFEGKDYTDGKSVAIPATGHSYGAPEWKWAEDHSAATATFKCAQGDDSQTLNAAITGEAVPDGGTKYTAAVVFGDKSYTDSAYAAPKYTLTVNYVNEGGAPVAEPYVSQLAEGEAYAVPSPALPRLIPDRAEVKGTMGAADIAETVTYSDDDVIITFVYNYNNIKDTTTQVAWRGEATTLKPNPFKKTGELEVYGLEHPAGRRRHGLRRRRGDHARRGHDAVRAVEQGT